jgi:hypothetical protein
MAPTKPKRCDCRSGFTLIPTGHPPTNYESTAGAPPTHYESTAGDREYWEDAIYDPKWSPSATSTEEALKPLNDHQRHLEYCKAVVALKNAGQSPYAKHRKKNRRKKR